MLTESLSEDMETENTLSEMEENDTNEETMDTAGQSDEVYDDKIPNEEKDFSGAGAAKPVKDKDSKKEDDTKAEDKDKDDEDSQITDGWQVIDGKTYYYKNGEKYTDWKLMGKAEGEKTPPLFLFRFRRSHANRLGADGKRYC